MRVLNDDDELGASISFWFASLPSGADTLAQDRSLLPVDLCPPSTSTRGINNRAGSYYCLSVGL